MKRIILLVYSVLFACTGFSQSRELTKAVKKGKNSSLIYQAEFKKVYKESNIKSWLEKRDYILVSYLEGEIARFGGYEKGIIGVRFLTRTDYDYLVAQEQERQRKCAAVRKRSFERNVRDIAIVGIAGYGGYKFVKSLFSPSSSSSSKPIKEYKPSDLDVDALIPTRYSEITKTFNISQSGRTVYENIHIETSYDDDGDLKISIWDTYRRFKTPNCRNLNWKYFYRPSNKTLYRLNCKGDRIVPKDNSLTNKEAIRWAVQYWINDVKGAF